MHVHQMTSTDPEVLTIYVLELQGGKYYVGKTKDLIRRFQEHTVGLGSVWTRKFKPVRILESFQSASEFDEDNYVKKYMLKYGVDNVRGGSYVSEVLDDKLLHALQLEFYTATDSCLRCGKKGHFLRDCPLTSNTTTILAVPCTRCGKTGHAVNQCVIVTKETQVTSTSCYRCGRDSHYVKDCYAATDANGKLLSDDSDDSDDPVRPPPASRKTATTKSSATKPPAKRPPAKGSSTTKQVVTIVTSSMIVSSVSKRGSKRKGYDDDDDDDDDDKECSRCGRDSHDSSTCYASYDIDRRPIKKRK